eukprot:CAMPEP_0180443308 /NCGR_PEP_ID=MMETSP1036_2-20121128/14601_1 /TAXON_ID=632150 /ORGANISM="Azadinium spinosum, Strain 3D9" /LENGTH=38 /DNA_ID= /DNA_START= /DNA_END= /DNA_ORIENTATION=
MMGIDHRPRGTGCGPDVHLHQLSLEVRDGPNNEDRHAD